MATAAAVLLLAWTAASARSHPAYEHELHGPPALPSLRSEFAPDAPRRAEDARRFAAALAAAPPERRGRCVETVVFEGVGAGCRSQDGLLRLRVAGGSDVLTHGPDYLEAGTDLTASTLAPRLVAAVQGASRDDVTCVPTTERHTRLVYAIPADGTDRSSVLAHELRQSTYELSAVIDNEARLLTPARGRRLRVACDELGRPTVDVLRLRTRAGSASFATVQADLLAATGSIPSAGAARFLVFYDAHLGSYAGIAQFHDDDSAAEGNHNNAGGRVALQDSSGGEGPDWNVLLHEVTHNMGGVQDTAPDSNSVGHCNDGRDVLCYAEPSTPGVTGTYTDGACTLEVFDCDHDTYFHTAPPSGSYLATRWNVGSTRNGFLEAHDVDPDTIAPSVPTGLTGSGHGSFVRLQWAPSADAGSGVHAYRVYRDSGGGTWVPVDDSWPGQHTLDATWSGIAANTTVALRLTAYDRRGNESAPREVTVNTGVGGTEVRVVGGDLPQPTNVHVAAATSSSITLAWSGHADRYRVQKRTSSGGWTTGSTTSSRSMVVTTTATGAALTAGTRHEYLVSATDANGRRSTTVQVAGWTTGAADTLAPAAPAGLAIASSSGPAPDLAWSGPSDAVSYVVSAQDPSGAWTQKAITTTTTVGVPDLAWGTSYTLGVASRDEAGNLSARTTVAFTTPPAPDTTPPSVPTLSLGSSTTTTIPASWSAATDNVGVVGYRVYVTRADANHFLLAAQTSSALNATIGGLAPSTAYWVRVHAVDAAGNASAFQSYSTRTTAADTAAPTQPAGLTASNQTQSSVDLSWNASTDAVGVAGYRVQRRNADLTWTTLSTTTDTTAHITGLAASTSYTFGVLAFDAAGNASTRATVTVVTSAEAPDLLAPSEPSNVAATAVTGTSATLAWTASSDDRAVTGYRIYREAPNAASTPVATTSGATEATIASLAPATTYRLAVSAIDAAGNESARTAVTFATPDTVPPSAPPSLVASGTTETSTTLSWGAATDNVAVTGYRISRRAPGEAVLGTTTSLTWTVGGLEAGRAYSFAVTAFDAAGNETSRTIDVTTPDQTAPTAPAGFAVSAITGTSADLSWSAASDNIGIAAYRVYREQPAASNTPITSTGSTATRLTSLAPGTAYRVAVTAVDAAGNESPRSILTFTTPDTIAPSAPGFVRTTDTTERATTIQWNAATDNVAVAGYRVARTSSPAATLGTTTALSWSVADLLPARTYTFRVTAFDAAGNETSASVTVTTPDTTAPTAPASPAAVARSGSEIELSWQAATDEVGVVAYRVRRVSPNPNPTPIATLAGSATSVVVGGLQSQTTYEFELSAVDAAGNESSRVRVGASTPDVTAPSVPTALAVAARTTSSIDLSWGASSDSSGSAVSYELSRRLAGASTWTFVGATSTTTWRFDGLTRSTAYELGVAARDAAGNRSPIAALGARTVDDVAPTRPGTLAVTAVTSSSVSLAWGASSDDVAVVAYDIHRRSPSPSSTPVASTTATSRVVSGLQSGISYTFVVTARDAAGNVSAETQVIVATTDDVPPTVPTRLRASAATDTSVTLAWDSAGDNVGVVRYDLLREVGGVSSVIATTTALEHAVDSLAPSRDYRFHVEAVDAAGLRSTRATLDVRTPDTTAPTAPADVVVTSTSDSRVAIAWSASSDAVGVVGYRVHDVTGGSPGPVVVTSAGTSATVGGLAPATSYAFEVVALDAAGNESPRAPLAVRTADTPDTTPPSAPESLSSSAVDRTSATLSWNPSVDAGGIAAYRVERSIDGRWVVVASSVAPGATLADLTAGTRYLHRVVALDVAGNESPPSSTIEFATTRDPDVTPPSQPSDLQATADARGMVGIAWMPATDASGIATYRVWTQVGAGWTLATTTSATTATVSGFAAGAEVLVGVSAVDTSGNESTRAAVRVRIPEPLRATTTVAAPAGLAVTATSTRIVISWQPTVAATRYRVVVRRGETLLTAVETTDTSVSFGPWAPNTSARFEVTAIGDAGPGAAATLDAATLRDTVRPTRPGPVQLRSPRRGVLMATWRAARDDVRLAHYELRIESRGQRPRILRAASRSRSLLITRLQPGRAYVVGVRAIDGSGNASPWVRARATVH